GGLDIASVTAGVGLENIATVYVQADGGVFVILPDGRYLSEGGFVDGVTVSSGGDAIPVGALSPQLNSPAEVLGAIGLADPARIEELRALQETRADPIMITPEDLASDAMLFGAADQPSVFIDRPGTAAGDQASSETGETLTFDSNSAEFVISAFLGSAPRGVLRIQVNGVLAEVIDVESPQGVVRRIPLAVELQPGDNLVQALLETNDGAASIPRSVKVYSRGRPGVSDTYFIGIGINEYEHLSDLRFPAQDVADIRACFADLAVGQFFSLDSIAQPELLRMAPDKLVGEIEGFVAKASPDDRVIFYFAGHGGVSRDQGPFLAMRDTSVNNLAGTSVLVKDVVKALARSPARTRFVMTDACADNPAVATGPTPISGSVAGTQSRTTLEPRPFTAVATAETSGVRFENFFAETVDAGGATVIAAAAEGEYAHEDTAIRNGVFTFALLEGLRSGRADIDGDASVSAEEAAAYTAERVRALTGGAQQPVVRQRPLGVGAPIARAGEVAVIGLPRSNGLFPQSIDLLADGTPVYRADRGVVLGDGDAMEPRRIDVPYRPEDFRDCGEVIDIEPEASGETFKLAIDGALRGGEESVRLAFRVDVPTDVIASVSADDEDLDCRLYLLKQTSSGCVQIEYEWNQLEFEVDPGGYVLEVAFEDDAVATRGLLEL
ncbi:MAG: caspase family protein, partial [Planctomycetota bacterium]